MRGLHGRASRAFPRRQSEAASGYARQTRAAGLSGSARFEACAWPSGRATSLYVLIVEDNPAEAELIQERLSCASAHGVTIKHALDMTRAASMYDDVVFDCVVLDLQLPDTEGRETIEVTHALFPSATIIAYSGMDNELSRLVALEAGAQHFVSKNTADVEALSRCVLDALERRRAFAEF
jgi:DNA-binding response OmpR family regulator